MDNLLHRISLIADNERISITALEKKIGASKGVLSRAINNNTDIQARWLTAIVENYPHYNATWLLTGIGNNKNEVAEFQPEIMYKSSKKIRDRVKPIQEIPLYDIDAAASVVTLFRDNKNNLPLDFIRVPNMPKCDGAIRITGDSMYPLLKSGDIVMYKEQTELSIFFWGEMYLVYAEYAGNEIFSAKYIQKSEFEGMIKLVSQNQHHQPVDIPINSIKGLALIKASIRFNSTI